MEKKDFDLLIESLEQALAHKRGEKKCRTIVLLDKEDDSVKRIRTKEMLSGRGIPVHLKDADE